MRPDPEALAESVESLEDLASFIDELSRDAVEYGSEWENIEIFDMLESMAAWLRDSMEGGGRGPVEEREVLRFVARLLLAGKHYE